MTQSPIEYPVAHLGARHTTVSFPVDQWQQLTVLPPAVVDEDRLVQTGGEPVELCLLKGLVSADGVRQFIGYTYHVGTLAQVRTGHDAVAAHPVIIEHVGGDSHCLGITAHLGGEEVVFMQESGSELQPMVKDKLTLVTPQHNTHKGEIPLLKDMPAVIVPPPVIMLLYKAVCRLCLARGLEITLSVEAEHVLSMQPPIEHLEGLGGYPVVAVEEEKIVTCSTVNGCVAGGTESRIGLVYDPVRNATVGKPFFVLFGNLPAAVGGTIVYCDDLAVGARLSQNALKAFPEVRFDIIDWYEYGEPGHGGRGGGNV